MPAKDSVMPKPIGITMGCPVGIGPEIVLRFLSDLRDGKARPAVVIGDKGVLERCAVELKLDVDIVSCYYNGTDYYCTPSFDFY